MSTIDRIAKETVAPSPAVAAVRWGVLILGLCLAGAEGAPPLTLVCGGVLLGHALWVTALPGNNNLAGAVIHVINETAVTIVVVGATGWYRSPYVICLAAPIVAAFFVNQAVRRAEDRESRALDQLEHLVEANELLSELHRVARMLPVSLDLRETVNSTVSRLRELIEPNVVVLLLHDDATDDWSVAAAVGARPPRHVATHELVPPLRDALTTPGAVLVADLGSAHNHLGETSSTGLYVALRARGRVVGLIAIERVVPQSLAERDRALLEVMSEQLGVAIDNARWFGRLRRIGADEERTRIARDLHDRVGQGLAYLAFELDRLTSAAGDHALKDDVATLRSDVRQILGEVRETLSDVRADVSESQDLVGTVDAFITRVERRTGLHVVFEHDGGGRLPLPIEREMWRIAQEAVTNAERHSGAETVRVRWHCTGGSAALEVVDDGGGMADTRAVKPGSYGLLGMRERADAIGASLEISSAVGEGTTVRCLLEQR